MKLLTKIIIGVLLVLAVTADKLHQELQTYIDSHNPLTVVFERVMEGDSK